jgi:hypothetical protein
MVLTPSLLLPAAQTQVAEGLILLAIFAAGFTLAEYGGRMPSLIEFRAAPPFNRVRFGILFLTVLLLSIALRAQTSPDALPRLVAALGYLIGRAVDFPLSPIALLMWLLPSDATIAEAARLRAAAGLAYITGLIGMTLFAIAIRLRPWPMRGGELNLWLNLPRFDPSGGPDLARRLRRDGSVNVLLGLLLPYVTPPLATLAARLHGVSVFDSDVFLVWTVALWAFLPACLFLRGIALRRLARTLAGPRRRPLEPEAAADPAFLPA